MKKILFVSGEQEIIIALNDLFIAIGELKMESVAEGSDALDKASKTRFDLLIIDSDPSDMK